jgi:hypothetical protein
MNGHAKLTVRREQAGPALGAHYRHSLTHTRCRNPIRQWATSARDVLDFVVKKYNERFPVHATTLSIRLSS